MNRVENPEPLLLPCQSLCSLPKEKVMDNFSEFAIRALGSLWIAVHLLGLFSSWMVRARAGRSYELLAQGSFFVAMLAVAITTVIGHLCCQSLWPLSAITLTLMVILAVVELGTAEASNSSS